MKRLFSYGVMTLVLVTLALVLVSWLLSATMTDGVRSLLSSEGVRWYLGSVTSMLASPWLIWLLLLAVACGSLWQSGLPQVLRRRPATFTYRERTALTAVILLLLLFLAVLALLTVVPHAVLLSSTGALFPSAFSRALVLFVAFALLLSSFTYGLMSGQFATLTDAVWSLTFGIRKAAPLIVLYILFMQLYESLKFVLS
jgi:aminobenzoyl-glutamate transport protein